MISNFFRTAWRNILKHKTYAIINFVGLTCGLTLSLLIFTYIRHEFSYDKFHDKLDRIYRIKYYTTNDFNLASTPPPIAPRMKEFFPEVEETARVYSRSVSISLAEKEFAEPFEERNVLFADSALTHIWTIDYVAGDPERALREPFGVVISEETAIKYFGDANPIGEALIFAGDKTFKVVAVAKSFPTNSHIQFNMLIPYENMFDLESPEAEQRLRNNLDVNFIISHSYTYVLLKPGASPEKVNARFDDFLKKYALPQLQRGQRFELFPLADVHLKSDMLAEPTSVNSYSTIYIFAGVGLLTLLIACINYINLATAQSFTRMKEIGIRKILGSARGQLIGQFLLESFLFCLIAFGLSIMGLYLTLPSLNQLTGSELKFLQVLDTPMLLTAVALLVLITLLAGGYPSIFATRFDSVNSLKGAGGSTLSSGNLLRKGLVVFQLLITSALISGSLMIVKQLRYLENRPLGFDRENILVVQLESQNLNGIFAGNEGSFMERLNSFRNTIQDQSSVRASSLTSSVVGTGIVFRGAVPEGFSQEDNMFVASLGADYDFLETYQVEVLTGRGFSRTVGSDPLEGFLVNEMAVKEFNWGSPEEALGKTINLEGKQGKVIGVVKDFNFASLTTPISPLLIDMRTRYSSLSISLRNENTQENIEILRNKWNELFPEKTFEFFFLDEQLNTQYQNYQNFGSIINYFTIIAVLISCLGVYGLILFVVQRKVKEIGVRKVLGSSVPGILKLIFAEFTWLILIAFIIAIPFSYYLISRWFENFVYHTSIDVLTYIVSLG
ncbi:MAG: FtsX-like permease family protein, partial [Cyclobacteriaceae bacterium]